MCVNSIENPQILVQALQAKDDIYADEDAKLENRIPQPTIAHGAMPEAQNLSSRTTKPVDITTQQLIQKKIFENQLKHFFVLKTANHVKNNHFIYAIEGEKSVLSVFKNIYNEDSEPYKELTEHMTALGSDNFNNAFINCPEGSITIVYTFLESMDIGSLPNTSLTFEKVLACANKSNNKLKEYKRKLEATIKKKFPVNIKDSILASCMLPMINPPEDCFFMIKNVIYLQGDWQHNFTDLSCMIKNKFTNSSGKSIPAAYFGGETETYVYINDITKSSSNQFTTQELLDQITTLDDRYAELVAKGPCKDEEEDRKEREEIDGIQPQQKENIALFDAQFKNCDCAIRLFAGDDIVVDCIILNKSDNNNIEERIANCRNGINERTKKNTIQAILPCVKFDQDSDLTSAIPLQSDGNKYKTTDYRTSFQRLDSSNMHILQNVSFLMHQDGIEAKAITTAEEDMEAEGTPRHIPDILYNRHFYMFISKQDNDTGIHTWFMTEVNKPEAKNPLTNPDDSDSDSD